MTNEIKKYCEGLDCAICDEKEPCIYKIANELQEQLKAKEQECEELNEELYYWVNGEYCDNKCNVVKELDQLKNCLTEIKEIAENGKRFAERYMITGEQKANVLTYANAILQKSANVRWNDEM
jgi:hypothetical protein